MGLELCQLLRDAVQCVLHGRFFLQHRQRWRPLAFTVETVQLRIAVIASEGHFLHAISSKTRKLALISPTHQLMNHDKVVLLIAIAADAFIGSAPRGF